MRAIDWGAIMASNVDDPRLNSWLESLPDATRQTIVGVTQSILESYPDILATIVVGSMATGDYDEHSDVDYAFVRDQRIPKPDIIRIRQPHPRIHFISYLPSTLAEHFNTGTMMAWAVKQGRIVHDPHGLLRDYLARPLSNPPFAWIAERLEYVTGWPDDAKKLSLKTINLAMLFLATQGIVRVTKASTGRQIAAHPCHEATKRAVEVAMGIRTGKPGQLSDPQSRIMRDGVARLTTEIHRALANPPSPRPG